MAIYCRICGFSSFRTSRFRFHPSDLSQLLFLRLPVRCTNCDERAFTSLKQFLEVRRSRKALHHEHHNTK